MPEVAGAHTFRIEVAKGKTRLAETYGGALEAVPYIGEHRFLRHGPLRISGDGRHFEHADGTPFFWLADTWWHAMCKRLTMDGFRTLVTDRREKGYNVIQFTIAWVCDVFHYDPRDTNEAGHSWEPGHRTINPAYWDLTDVRVRHLVDSGIAPCMMGSWAYHIAFLGIENMKRHWRYVIARYGAFPLTWTLCGEATLCGYRNLDKPLEVDEQRRLWTEVGRYVQSINVFERPLSAHPLNNRQPLDDMGVVDFYLGQLGHSALRAYRICTKMVNDLDAYRHANPGKPALVSEVVWEHMDAACGPREQRYIFWLAVLNGAPGHSYGADALWQMARIITSTHPSPPIPTAARIARTVRSGRTGSSSSNRDKSVAWSTHPLGIQLLPDPLGIPLSFPISHSSLVFGHSSLAQRSTSPSPYSSPSPTGNRGCDRVRPLAARDRLEGSCKHDPAIVVGAALVQPSGRLGHHPDKDFASETPTTGTALTRPIGLPGVASPATGANPYGPKLRKSCGHAWSSLT